MAEENAEFEVWQDDMVIASTSGSRDFALAEAVRYASQYLQDGPTQIIEVIRKEITWMTAPPAPGTEGE